MNVNNQVRMQIRTTVDEKDFLERAARRCGFKTLSEFVRVSAHEKAKRDLKEFPEYDIDTYQTPTEPTRLSAVDSSYLAESILNSKEPNALIKELFSSNNEEILKKLLQQEDINTASR